MRRKVRLVCPGSTGLVGFYRPLTEECGGDCQRENMVVTTTHNMKETREERMARYKEERRRALAAQFGPREVSGPVAPRSTRASRLRSLANTENLKSTTTTPTNGSNKEEEENGDPNKKDKDNTKRRSLLGRSASHNETTHISPGDTGARRRSGIISTSVSGVCSSNIKKSSSINNNASSPIPKSSQLVRNQIISNQRNERGSTPDSDASSCSSRFGRKAVTCSSPINLSPSHKNKQRSRASSIPAAVAAGIGTTGTVSSITRSSGTPPSSPSKAAPSVTPTPHSILKKSYLTEEHLQINPAPAASLPVSILKRKTSHDEGAARCASPVRFSSSVVEKKGRGILKKYRSLDETHVDSQSLQDYGDETKPILKNGQERRRCSLEEVSARSSEPQGILKRKASREETDPTPEPPQGILKRRTSPLVSTESLSPEPILKKKEEPHVEPRPILKKKSSWEEDGGEHHSGGGAGVGAGGVRPILKESPARRRPPLSATDHIHIRPILKQTEEVFSIQQQAVTAISTVVLRPRPRRSYPVENRLSLDPTLLRRPTLSEDEPKSRPMSVAERVLHMEANFNSLDSTATGDRRSISPRMEEEDVVPQGQGLERSGSVSERASIFTQLEQKERLAAAADKARRTLKGFRSRNKVDGGGRFSTQPVTVGEVEQAKRNNDPTLGDDPCRLSLAERVALFTKKEEVQIVPPRRSLDVPSGRRRSDAPLLVEGLMKNLAEKAGAKTRLLKPTLTASPSTSSSEDTEEEDEEEEDDRISPIREAVGGVWSKDMGEVRTLRRCATQPISTRDEADDAPPLTIAERLAALKKNGHSSWMKRLAKPSPEEELSLSAKPPPVGGSRFSEKLGQLEIAAEGWKSRVSTPDSHQFSVAGRMGPVEGPGPALGSANRTPVPAVFLPPAINAASMSTPSVPDSLASLMKRSISVPEGKENDNPEEAPVVKVPSTYDEDFTSFFLTADLERLQASDLIEAELADLERISAQTSSLTVVKRNVRVSRKHRSTNPVKALAARSDLKSEYVEVMSGVADREIRRINIEKLSKSSNLAVEALAGLASKEDITGVCLKKPESAPLSRAQWRHPLLLRVKGRRHPITSVVRPVYTSVNQGDSFILVTKDQVFHWVGEFCSLTEKSRGSDIAQEIAHRKDLGCTGAISVTTLESSATSERHKDFWRLLALPDLLISSYKGESAGHPDEDSVYEVAMTETYMVYRLQGDKLVPIEEFWGKIPRIVLLKPTDVLVFDFRSEVYLWSGKNADMADKKVGSKLAQELYKTGYNSSWHPTGISWLDEEMEQKERPEWSVMCRVTQHMEPVIFKEKFFDWPDFTKVIRSKNLVNGDGSRTPDGSVEVRPCDIKDMLSWSSPEPDLVLEGTHLGRGKSYYDEESRRLYEVKTLGLDIWHIHDYNRTLLERASHGHFHRGDSYVLRWNYSVTVTGRELSGVPSKHGSTGRERVAYITWHGQEAPTLEQGAAALHTVSLDSEAAVQLTVEGGREPSAFLALLEGAPLLRHAGTRADHLSNTDDPKARLYIVSGEVEGETCLDEVPLCAESLRSRASLWLVQPQAGLSYLWHGAGSSVRKQAAAALRTLASSSAPELTQNTSATLGFEEIEEGEEPDDFLGGSEKIDRICYDSLLRTKKKCDGDKEEELAEKGTIKLFHMSSLLGDDLEARGVVSPRTSGAEGPRPAFPYLQTDLYQASQPAVFVLETRERVWVWTGWWSGEEPSQRGSLTTRHQAEKRAAYTVALGYARAVGSPPSSVVSVAAGLEPPSFRAHFHLWAVHGEARAANLEEGHKTDEMLNVQEELLNLTRATYPASQLTSGHLPAGVDPTRLELYLNSQQFKELLGVTKEEFSELPSWKQTNLKKTAGLF